MNRRTRILLPLIGLMSAASGLRAAELAIIIDDLGYGVEQARSVAALPGPLAVAVLPDAPRAVRVANIAAAAGKEVLLHLPLQAVDTEPTAETLTLDTSESALVRRIESALAHVPHVSGINSHQGSLLTRHPGHMSWLMKALQRHPELYFIDSYTTERSVALQVAAEYNVPALRRHVFLDAKRDVGAIRHELERARARARRDGYAIAIGHPYPATLAVLNDELPALTTSDDVRLVAVSELVARYGLPQELAHE